MGHRFEGASQCYRLFFNRGTQKAEFGELHGVREFIAVAKSCQGNSSVEIDRPDPGVHSSRVGSTVSKIRCFRFGTALQQPRRFHRFNLCFRFGTTFRQQPRRCYRLLTRLYRFVIGLAIVR